MLTHPRPPALIRSAAFLDSTRGVVPDECELVIVAQPKLIEDADRPTSPNSTCKIGMRLPRRIYHRVARIGIVDDRNDRKVCILWHRRRVEVSKRRYTGKRFQLIDVHDLLTRGRARSRHITAVHRGRLDHSAIEEAHRILLHRHACFLRCIDRNAERASHEGGIVRMITVSMPEKDGFGTKTNQIFHNQRGSAQYGLSSMDVRIQ